MTDRTIYREQPFINLTTFTNTTGDVGDLLTTAGSWINATIGESRLIDMMFSRSEKGIQLYVYYVDRGDPMAQPPPMPAAPETPAHGPFEAAGVVASALPPAPKRRRKPQEGAR